MIKHRANSNYVLVRGDLVSVRVRAAREGRRLVEVRLRLSPPGRWRDLPRVEAPDVGILAWSDAIDVDALGQLPPESAVTVIGHLVADPRGLEVLADAISVDPGVVLAARPAPAAPGVAAT
jgi:hypothetical protein